MTCSNLPEPSQLISDFWPVIIKLKDYTIFYPPILWGKYSANEQINASLLGRYFSCYYDNPFFENLGSSIPPLIFSVF
jgi:hypothetical protein